MCAHILLNLFKRVDENKKNTRLANIYHFLTFNKTGAQMLASIYHMI